jgi:hypothetical protein
VPVTNIVRHEIVAADEMPLRMVCHTPCFRSEAGAYGKDVRGLIRQHQFEKVELVQVVKASESEQAHEDLTEHAENILKRTILVTGTSAVGIKYKSGSSLTLNKSSANFGNCPVPYKLSALTIYGT